VRNTRQRIALLESTLARQRRLFAQARERGQAEQAKAIAKGMEVTHGLLKALKNL
jgi:hypothetical protein